MIDLTSKLECGGEDLVLRDHFVHAGLVKKEDEDVESGQSRNVNENVAQKKAWTKRRVKNITGTGVDVQAETTEGFLS